MTTVEMLQLGDVAEFVRGVTFRPEDVAEGDSPNSVWCMRTKNVQSTLDISDVWSISPAHVKRNNQYLNEGDILVSSANSWNLIGKCSWVPKLNQSSTFGGFISTLRAKRQYITPRYLYHWFSSPKTQFAIRSFGRQTTNISNLDLKRCLEMSVPVPEIETQKRITDLLDRVESARSKRRRSLELLDELTQSLFFDMFGDPGASGSRWESVNFSEALTASPRNGLSPSKGGGFSASVLTLSSVTGESFNPDAQKEATFKEAPPSEKSVRRNDFLVCRGNGNVDLVGRGHFPTEDMPNMTFPDTIIASPVDQGKLSPKFLETLWKQNSTREQIKSVARTTNGTFKINQRSLENIKIIIPPISLQWEFSEKVRKIEEAKDKHLTHLAHLDELFSSVQQRAFDGTLWDDPTVTS